MPQDRLDFGNHDCQITATRFAESANGKPCVIVTVQDANGTTDESSLWLTEKAREGTVRNLRALGWNGEADLNTGEDTPLKGVRVGVTVGMSADNKYRNVRLMVSGMVDAAPKAATTIASILQRTAQGGTANPAGADGVPF